MEGIYPPLARTVTLTSWPLRTGGRVLKVNTAAGGDQSSRVSDAYQELAQLKAGKGGEMAKRLARRTGGELTPNM